MTRRGSAARYARALLDVGRKEGDPQAIAGDLSSLAALMREHETLGRALVNPAVPVQRKVALVAALADHAGFGTVSRKLFLLLASRDRLALLPDLLDEYQRRLLDAQGVVRAEVATAVPLSAERAGALRAALAERTGRVVSMSTGVDPSILGGVVARIGSVVYDGSVKRQLERIRETLTR